MEDENFQQQLHSLKDRVNALTLQYSPKPAYVAPAAVLSPPGQAVDPFTAQLYDVKAHLDFLQASISKCEASMRQQPNSSSMNEADGGMAAQSRMTLPSGPLFWQLFNSLRSDFQGLDTRVAGLEQDVDALEDRVDRLEPDQFTPAGSTASHEDGGVQISQQQTNEDLLGASMACLPELYTEDQRPTYPPVPEQQHSRISSLQSQRNGAFEWQWPAGNYLEQQEVRRPYATPFYRDQATLDRNAFGSFAQGSMHVPSEGVAFREREIARMDDQLQAVQDSLKSTEALATSKDDTIADLQAHISALQSDNQRMAGQIAKGEDKRKGQDVLIAELFKDLGNSNTAPMKQAKAEIESLRADSQRVAEQIAKETQTRQEQEKLIGKLQRELEESRGAYYARDEEWQKKNDSQQMTIADREVAIRYWQQRHEHNTQLYHRTIDERDHALQRWEESYNAVSDAWREENKRALSLSSELDHYRSFRRKEVDQLHRQYQREMDRLKEFCEHKDVVIGKQETVMSEGGKLLEERDAEIDRLQRRLRVAEDDMQHESRQQKRMARLLDETQSELERLRTISGEVKDGDDGARNGQDAEYPATMAASTEAVDGRESEYIVPRPDDYPRERSPSIECRHQRRFDSSYGSDASSTTAVRNGSPRRRRLRRHESTRHLHPHSDDRYPQRRERRRSSPHPRSRRMATEERPDRSDRFVADNADIPKDRRRARFLDDSISFNNPIPPAPIGSARKMASEADLRRGDRSGSRNLSKHQSMQELPGARRRLQAYVESEDEVR